MHGASLNLFTGLMCQILEWGIIIFFYKKKNSFQTCQDLQRFIKTRTANKQNSQTEFCLRRVETCQDLHNLAKIEFKSRKITIEIVLDSKFWLRAHFPRSLGTVEIPEEYSGGGMPCRGQKGRRRRIEIIPKTFYNIITILSTELSLQNFQIFHPQISALALN